jgi:RNase P subunit RPR2
MSGERVSTISGAQAVACPKCNAPLVFFRSSGPHIDDCGFESYRIACRECGASLAGVIDPSDETLLLTDMTP